MKENFFKSPFDYISNLAGHKSENIIKNILVLFKRNLFIVDFMDTGKYSRQDLSGIDFFIIFIKKSKRCTMGLQVKTSKYHQGVHKLKYPKIPSIRVEGRSKFKLQEVMKQIIKKYGQGEIVHL